MSATIGSTIYTKLIGSSDITGLVGTSPKRIYPEVAPLSMANQFPYIVYKVVSENPTNTKGPSDPGDAVATGPETERSPLDVVRVQVSCFTDDYSVCATLAQYIRAALDRGVGSGFSIGAGPTIDSIVYDGYHTLYEKDIKPQGVYHFAQDYIIRVINTVLI